MLTVKSCAICAEWDPLPQLIDDAATGPGGITALGLYMFAIKMAVIGKMPNPFAVIASGGYDEVRFVAPTRTDDVVTLLIETVEPRASKSKQDRGIVLCDSVLPTKQAMSA